MKKILFSIFILALPTMIGCQKSEVAEDNLSKQVTVTANIAGSSTTRVALTSATDAEDHPIVKVAWEESGESFKVWGDNNNHSTFTQTATLDDASNEFSGTLPASQSNKYLAVYPASVDAYVWSTGMEDDSPLNYFLDCDYIFTQQDGTLSEDKTLMIAEFNGDNFASLEFQHKAFLLMPTFKVADVQIPTDKIESITLFDMALAGWNSNCVVDCSSLDDPDDDLYIYIYDPSPNTREYRDHPDYNGDYYIREINLEVDTSDGKTYEGTIHMPTDYALQKGNLYTATVSLTLLPPPSVITYTTTNNQQLFLNEYDWESAVNTSKEWHTWDADSNIGTIILKNGVTAVPEYAFNGQTSLATFTLPSCITTIGNYAFARCGSLKEITMPNVTSIGEYAFYMEKSEYATNLKITDLDLSKVTTIGQRAFDHWISLLSVNISEAQVIGNHAFNECGRLKSVTMPTHNLGCTLGESAFAHDTELMAIDLTSVTTIYGEALAYVRDITKIIINRETPPTIEGNDILLSSNGEVKIYVPDSAVETYKNNSSWSQYATKILAISEMAQ